MYNIPDVSLKVIENKKKYGVFEIKPLVNGFGHTVGSALRRTLYAATKGAAISKVQIDGVAHQFTTIDGAKEDVLRILLNLKKVRFIKHGDEEVEVTIDKKGPGDVVAGDIQVVSGVEVANKDLVITTLSDKKKSIKITMTVESGYKYRDVEEHADVPVGNILLDCMFSPIINVETRVEPTRVGKETDFDMLTIKVTTDGTVDAEEAVRNAAKVLKEFFFKVQTGEEYNENDEVSLLDKITEDNNDKMAPEEVLVEELRFSTRMINALKKAGIHTLEDLAMKSEDELFKIRNVGEKSIREIIDYRKKEGLEPKEDDK